jgi:glyceraldehyde 3-phosphate dehydrogenase
LVRVGINGFGRIGRCLARLIQERDDLELVKINASGTLEQNTHLLRFDSIHGRFAGELADKTTWSHTRNIDEIDWTGVDVVLECTGAFNDGAKATKHISSGAKKVVISAPAKNVDKTIVYGVNHEDIAPGDKVISNSSCTTNCLAPMAMVLHKEFTIKRGMMTTIHSYTGDQCTVDRRHKDPYRSRTAGMSMIPTSTGATKAIGSVIPELAGKIEGTAIRVPTPNVSCVDFTFETDEHISVDDINHALYTYSKLFMKGILGFEKAPLVSVDYNHTTESCIIAADQTKSIANSMGRVLAWYDNEWAFSCRMADTASYIGQLNNEH